MRKRTETKILTDSRLTTMIIRKATPGTAVETIVFRYQYSFYRTLSQKPQMQTVENVPLTHTGIYNNNNNTYILRQRLSSCFLSLPNTTEQSSTLPFASGTFYIDHNNVITSLPNVRFLILIISQRSLEVVKKS